MRALLVIATAGLLTSPAIAGRQDREFKPPKEKKVCRSERPTGSYIAKRTCHTAAEWKAIDSANAGNARAMLDKVGQPTGDGKSL